MDPLPERLYNKGMLLIEFFPEVYRIYIAVISVHTLKNMKGKGHSYGEQIKKRLCFI